MKRFTAVLLFLLPLLCSCLLDTPETVEVVLREAHPFEEESGAYFWHELTWFDGEDIQTVHVPTGQRAVDVKVRTGSLCVFVLKPLGALEPIGAFFEPGDDDVVYASGEDGSFAEMLLYVAQWRPEAVSRLSMKALKESYPDLTVLDEVEFMSDLVDGTLYNGQLSYASQETLEVDSISSGDWLSGRYDIQSFSVAISGRTVYLTLYPGSYYYACFDRSLLLSLVYTEEGEVSTSITELPEW